MSAVNNSVGLEQLGYSNRLSDGKKDRLGQDEFLKLMTTQLANQDPMKPMESGDFLGQIAQFGTVSGIEDLQSSFSQLASSLSSNQALQAASLIDREVLVPAGRATLNASASIEGAVALERRASDVVVSIHDTNGELVRRISLGAQEAGLVDFKWDGRDANGDMMAQGSYDITAQAYNGATAEAQEILISSRVQSVTINRNGGALMLSLDGLGDVEFSKVRQIA